MTMKVIKKHTFLLQTNLIWKWSNLNIIHSILIINQAICIDKIIDANEKLNIYFVISKLVPLYSIDGLPFLI